MMQRAAVLIGVSRTGNLVQLQAVKAGISAMQDWIAGQPGFIDNEGVSRIVTITDSDGPVDAYEIKAAVTALVKQGTIEQLFIYFAGHGVNIRFSEYWLLSGAPEDPNEAVNVRSSAELARFAGIRHIVFLSDACRTAADSIDVQAITGTVIFPNPGTDIDPGYVDLYYATMVGRPSFEIRNRQQPNSYEAIYTHELVQGLSGAAASNPFDGIEDPNTIEKIEYSVNYVYPWPLKRYLEEAVPKRIVAHGVETTISQKPDAILQSDPNSWLAAVALDDLDFRREAIRRSKFAERRKTVQLELGANGKYWEALRTRGRPETIYDVVNDHVRLALGIDPITRQRWTGKKDLYEDPSIFTEVRSHPLAILQHYFATDAGRDYQWMHSRLFSKPQRDRPGISTGFVIQGSSLVQALSISETRTTLFRDRAIVRLDAFDEDSVSVLLVFPDGHGALLPALPNYIGTLVYDRNEQDLLSVDYKFTGHRWYQIGSKPFTEKSIALSRVLTIAATLGVFRLSDDNREALMTQNHLFPLNPTLAVYAAHVLYEANRIGDIRKIYLDQVHEHGTELFDIALLSRSPAARRAKLQPNLSPALPMLSRTWAMLGGSNIDAPSPFEYLRLQRCVTNSVWTLLNPEGVAIVRKGIESGEIK